MVEKFLQLAKHRPSMAVLMVTLLLARQPVRAAPFTFEFSGEVIAMYSDSGGLAPSPWNAVQIGDAWSLTYAFESTAPDTDIQPTFGIYTSALLSYTLIVGPASESASFDHYISIENHHGFRDAYDLNIFPPSSNPQRFQVLLIDSTNTSWGADVLPTSLNFAGFDHKELFVTGPSATFDWWILGNVETFAVVPEPAAGLLALLPIAVPWRRPRPNGKTSQAFTSFLDESREP
jgi:hypothetical protein